MFTVGMAATDTPDGRRICHLSRSSQAAGLGSRCRRIPGWLIVAISCDAAACNIGKALLPAIALDDLAFSLAGAALVGLTAAGCVWLLRRRAAQPGALRGTG